MKKSLFLVALFTTSMLQAEIIRSHIHAIDGDIIKFSNGRVAFLDFKRSHLSASDYVEAHVDEKSSLISIRPLTPPVKNSFKLMSLTPEERSAPLFEPSIVPSMEEAWNIFKRSNPNYKRISECTDRAHVWAHDEFKFSGTKSRKAFVFFTASYINSVRFKWWFHVAPLYKVNDRGVVKELVMDYRYTDRPMTIQEWTDQFVFTKRPCKVTTKFSEYDVNPQTESCYFINESMHYKIPGEIYEQETSNRYKTITTESELRAAFNYGFLK